MVAIVERTFPDQNVAVDACSVAAVQVANEQVIVLDGQDAMAPTDQRILKFQVAIRGAPDQELGRIHDHGAGQAVEYRQCDFHGNNSPDLGMGPNAQQRGHDRTSAGANRLPENGQTAPAAAEDAGMVRRLPAA
jgi:hypothetical protein